MTGPAPAPAAVPLPGIVAGPPTLDDRIALLLLLAGLFAAPATPETIASLRHGSGADLLARCAGQPGLAEPSATLRAALDRLTDEGEDEAGLARRLSPVFGLLFLGLAGPATVAPYESVHRCGGRLFQAPTGEMERLLAAHGLSAGLDHEPADHLSVETALLAHLTMERHPDRIAVADRLRGWLPLVRAGLTKADGSGVYAAAADLLAAAIDLAHVPEDRRSQA